jgi:hypothetical protein
VRGAVSRWHDEHGYRVFDRSDWTVRVVPLEIPCPDLRLPDIDTGTNLSAAQQAALDDLLARL